MGIRIADTKAVTRSNLLDMSGFVDPTNRLPGMLFGNQARVQAPIFNAGDELGPKTIDEYIRNLFIRMGGPVTLEEKYAIYHTIKALKEIKEAVPEQFWVYKDRATEKGLNQLTSWIQTMKNA
eukprot:1463122-Rhodomonas_salina.1